MRYIACAYLLIIAALFAAPADARHPDTPPEREPLLEATRWRIFDDPDEVASLYINDIIQTIGNTVYLATDEGLIEYRGTYLAPAEVPALPDDVRYNCLLYAVDGTIWAGTSAGLVRYVGHEWTNPIRSGNVTALAEAADGAIWAGISPMPAEGEPPSAYVYANVGIFRYRYGRWQRYGPADGLPAGRIHALYGDAEGGVWAIFGTRTHTEAIYRFFDGRWEDMRARIGIPPGDVLAIAQTADGAYWFGTYGRGVWRWKDGRWHTFADEEISTFTAASLLPMPDGSLWAVGAPAGTIWRYVGGRWERYPVWQVGIAGRMITKMIYALDDAFWFLIAGRGVARFDRRGGPWWIYGQEHGLPPTASVSHIARGEGNSLWIGTTEGLLKYEKISSLVGGAEDVRACSHSLCHGETPLVHASDMVGQAHPTVDRFVTPPIAPYVSDKAVTALLVWPDGRIWIASGAPTSLPGIWQFDGRAWMQLATAPTLDREAAIRVMLRARNGEVWVGTTDRQGSGGYGVFRLRGGRWRQFTTRDGLPDDRVFSLAEDSAGGIWVGTERGVARFDGRRWQRFAEEGAPRFRAWTLLAAHDGSVWVGGNTPNAGVSRYKDGAWSHFTTKDGLASNDVWSIVEAEDGTIWFGTSGGVSRYDGTNWISFHVENGLAKDQVWAAALAADGSLWFGHFDGAITKYHAISTDAPQTFIEQVPERVAHPGFLTIRWWGRDMWDRTERKDLFYSWRLDDGPWRYFTHHTSYTFETLPRGRHTFSVRAMDQEGNVDLVGATVGFVVLPPFWLAWWFLVPTIVGVVGITIAAAIAVQRNRRWRQAQAQLVGELQRELQVAQRLQMELLPREDPEIPGLQITGLCKPASRVGGDYFTYLWAEEHSPRVGIVVADVTGHAMQAAIPAVLFSGMLAAVARQTDEPAEMLRTLNESLRTRTGSHTFICCTIAVFDMRTHTLHIANAGGLDPIRQNADGVETISVEGERLPLGMLAGVSYTEKEVPFRTGDTFVFLTDGIVEARSPEGELFGFERVVRTVASGGEAGKLRERLLRDVYAHLDGREPDDDITLLIVQVTGHENGEPSEGTLSDAVELASETRR